MSRFHPDWDVTPILDGVRKWRDTCLVGDGSIFMPTRGIWTLEHANELDRDFVQRLDTGEGDFLGKLSVQLEPSTALAKQLAAEMLWVQLLFPDNVRPPKKREIIGAVWGWSGEPLPQNHPALGEDVLKGVGNAGQGYNSYRWKELAWFVRFLQIVKGLEPSARATLLADPWESGRAIEDVPAIGYRQFPNILRYLLHPESYERITIGSHKQKILSGFGKPSGRGASDFELDRELFDLRRELAEQNGNADFDFYQPEFRQRWSPASRAWLLCWNPQNWAWESFEADRASTAAGRRVRMSWRCGARGPQLGDPTYLARTGAPPRGLMARGVVARPAYTDVHFDPARAAKGETTRFIEVDWTDIRDPARDAYLSPNELRAQVSADQTWAPAGSGIGIPAEVAEALDDAWSTLPSVEVGQAPAAEPNRRVLSDAPRPFSSDEALDGVFMERHEFERILRVWRLKKNIVLQGAPGVGKTFIARRLAFALLGEVDLSRVETVQFHQSYGYEDFVQGYRPTDDGSFTLQDGLFTRFCELARADPDRPYVFIVDEINRGNLSKIFGELMLLIERDKRGMGVRLAYARPDDDLFRVPVNLYLIGMMNTADRSLSLVDYALRRRFAFITLDPAFGSERYAAALAEANVPEAEIQKVVRGMTALNEDIGEDTANLGPGFRIGHSFFTPGENERWSEGWYEEVIETEIRPLLEEYWFDNPKKARDWVSRLLATAA